MPNKPKGKINTKPKSKRPAKPVSQALDDTVVGDDGLTNKQRVFVEKYIGVAHFNATEAASAAGYKGNRNTLAVVGHDNLRKPNIAALVKQRLAELAMEPEEILARLSDQARGTLDNFVNAKGKIDLAKARRGGMMHLLKSYSRTEKGDRIEIYDAQAALVQLGRHHGLFVDKVEFDEPITIKMDK